MSQFDTINKSMHRLYRARTELDPLDLMEGGRYHKSYCRIQSEIGEEAMRLCKMYLVEPFRMGLNTPKEQFETLVRQETQTAMAALRESDSEKLKETLRESFRKESEWIVEHGGMFRLPLAEREEIN